MTTRLPLVSAIIPTYNRSAIVRDAIDSVLSQTYGNIEIVVVDDGSTDDTVASLRTYGERIRVISQDNAGPAAARNRGAHLCNGNLVAFLDSDDLWTPSKVERQVTLLQKAGESVPCCLTNIMMRWRDRDITSFAMSWLNPYLAEGIWFNVAEVLATRFVLINQGIMIRRSAFQRIGGFRESLRLLEDGEMSMRLSLEGPWAFIREQLVIWRESAISCYNGSRQNQMELQATKSTIISEQLSRISDSGDQKMLRRYLNRELNRIRRQLKASELQRRTCFGASLAGELIARVERYRQALSRRSPWFPKMEVAPVGLLDVKGALVPPGHSRRLDASNGCPNGSV